jgi:TPR repeat protein
MRGRYTNNGIFGTLVSVCVLMIFVTPTKADDLVEVAICHQLPQIQKNAEGGDPQAEGTLAKLNYGGQCGVIRDYVKAVKWAQLSAEQGNATGEAMLALLLNQGLGVTRDDVEAIRWARLSAEQGHVPGEDYLALMLHHGWGTPRNDVEAIKWARLSANQGDAQGQGFLALLLAEEPNHKDDIEAVKWARLSAEQGHSGGQFTLGTMYSTGRGGLPKDYVEADKWYILSSRRNSIVVKIQKPLETLMSKVDIAEANGRADAWKPKENQPADHVQSR